MQGVRPFGDRESSKPSVDRKVVKRATHEARPRASLIFGGTRGSLDLISHPQSGLQGRAFRETWLRPRKKKVSSPALALCHPSQEQIGRPAMLFFPQQLKVESFGVSAQIGSGVAAPEVFHQGFTRIPPGFREVLQGLWWCEHRMLLGTSPELILQELPDWAA